MRSLAMSLFAVVLLLASCSREAATPVESVDASSAVAANAPVTTAPVVVDPDTGVAITGVPAGEVPMTKAPRHPIATAPRVPVGELPPIDDPAPATRRESRSGLDPYLEYNKATEITVHGAINGFSRVPLTDSRTGLFVRINAGGAFPYIYLGPEQWLFFNGIDPKMTNTILAEGSRVGNVIMARKLVWNGYEYELRNADGVPFWTEPAIAASPATPDQEPVHR